jgi:lysophospholipase L1-like esterase
MKKDAQRIPTPRNARNPKGRIAANLPVILAAAVALTALGFISCGALKNSAGDQKSTQWIGTWAAAAQPFVPSSLETYQNQSLRMIVHTSAAGNAVRIKISNTYGDKPLLIGGAHIARRAADADIDPNSDRTLNFQGKPSTTVDPGSIVTSDPVELDVPAVSDLAVSLFLPQRTEARTVHALAMQTSYISTETGDSTATTKFPVQKKLHSWPFLTGVDVEVPLGGDTIVAFGSSLTDGDGTTPDTNSRWPDVLSKRLQTPTEAKLETGVLNEGIIGNRLLHDSPKVANNPFAGALGEAGLTRFDRDVLAQAGVKYVIVGLGINDILFPAFPFTPPSETVSADEIIAGYRQLIARGHQKGVRVIGTTNPPFENSFFEGFVKGFYTPEREVVRQKVNDWIRASGEFDGMVDLDAILRDPSHPQRLLPAYDSGDHLHPNDAGCAAEGNAFPLALFGR